MTINVQIVLVTKINNNSNNNNNKAIMFYLIKKVYGKRRQVGSWIDDWLLNCLKA